MSRTFGFAFALFALAVPLRAYQPPSRVAGLNLAATWSESTFLHGDGVISLSVAGDHLVSGDKGGHVMLWKADGHEVHAHPHGELVLATALAPGGRRFAVAGSEGRVVIANVGIRETTILRGHKDWVQSLAWSPDGAFLVSASRDQEMRVWNAHTGKLLHTVPGGMSASGAAAISPDSKMLAATSKGGTTIWSFQDILKSGKRAKAIATLPVHPGGTTAIAFEPKTPRVITAGADGALAFFRLPDGTPEARVQAHTPGVSSLAVSPDGFHLATCGGDELVKIWALDPATNPANMRSRSLKLPEGRAHCVAFLDDSTVLAGTESGAIVRLPVPTGAAFEATANVSTSAVPGGVVALAVSSDGKTLAVAESTRVVRLRDAATGAVTGVAHAGELVRALQWLPGGRLVAGGERAQVEIVQPAPQVIGAQSPWVTALALAPDGKTLASGAGNATIKVWDLASGKEVSTLVGHRAQIDGLAYLSPARLASISRDRRVGLWDLPGNKVEATLVAHESAITALAANADGTRIATGGENGEAYLWAPPATRPVVKMVCGSKAPITAIAFERTRENVLVADRAGLVESYWQPKWPPAKDGDTIPEQRLPATAGGFGLANDRVTAFAKLPDGSLLFGTARGALLVYK